MKYLSFDIECSDGKHICEFGYVLFDENFVVIDRDCILINPEYKFHLVGRDGRPDIELAYSEEEYNNSPTYAEKYEEIKRIIETPDCQIIGFAIQNDKGYLAKANKKYKKPAFSIKSVDVQRLYKRHTKAKYLMSAEKIIQELGIDGIRLHKSEDDAYAAMLILKAIIEKEQKTLPDYLRWIKDNQPAPRKKKAKSQQPSNHTKDITDPEQQAKYIKNRLRGYEKITPRIKSFFTGKVVCIGADIQKRDFGLFNKLVKSLYYHGAKYNGRASECDIFIFGDDPSDKRLVVAQKANESNDKHIRFVGLKEAAKKLHVVIPVYTTETSMEDFVKAKGIDLSSLIEKNDE